VDEALNRVAGNQPAVVLQLQQTDLELGAWVAWAATRAGTQPDDVFWLVGDAGSMWRLAKDVDGGDPPTIPPEAVVERVSCRPWSSRRPFVSINARRTRFRWSEILAALPGQFHKTELPGRRLLDGRMRWVVERRDSWGTGGPAWQVRLEVADQPPRPHWPVPAASLGRILGEVAEDWTQGKVWVDCRLASGGPVFPLRLTTFDAGNASRAGWQWVPTKGNRVAIDTDWSLTGLPALRYAERTEGASNPYLADLPPNQSWLPGSAPERSSSSVAGFTLIDPAPCYRFTLDLTGQGRGHPVYEALATHGVVEISRSPINDTCLRRQSVVSAVPPISRCPAAVGRTSSLRPSK